MRSIIKDFQLNDAMCSSMQQTTYLKIYTNTINYVYFFVDNLRLRIQSDFLTMLEMAKKNLILEMN